MASISSPGLGSGIDVASLVNQLVAVEGQAPSQRLDTREAELQARLSAYGTLRSAFSGLEVSLASLKTSSTFQNKSGVSSDSEVLTVSATSAAEAATYDVTVTDLATQHRIATDTTLVEAQFTSLTDVVGTGDLTFRFGTGPLGSFAPNPDKPSKTVEITDGSLTGIRDSINEAEIGVDASIVFNGSHYRLVLSSEDTGAANSLEISVTDDDLNNTDTGGLSLLAYNATAAHVVETEAAQDASLNINGIAITSASNKLTDTIDGLTIDLVKGGGATSTITVSQDSGAISSNISNFVAKYNALIGTINDLSSFDPETNQSGILNGDAVLRGLDTQVRRIVSDPLTGTEGFTVLAEIGITRSADDGTLVLDNTKLDEAIEDDLEGVISLFAAFGKTPDSQINFSTSTSATQAGDYAINVTQLATQGQAVGSAAANLTITAGVNDTLSLSVDGIATSVTLTAGNYTAATLAAELQSQLNGDEVFVDEGVATTVSQAAGVLTITSNRFGSASKVSITGGNAATDLLGGSPTATDGVDVAGTIGGFEAVGSGQTLTGTNAVDGLAIEVTGGVLGNRGDINFSRGYAEELENYIDGLLATGGIFDGVTDGINSQIEDINDDRETLALRLTSLEDRLRAQFTAMDILVSQLQNTSNFLTQQLASLPTIRVNSNSNS